MESREPTAAVMSPTGSSFSLILQKGQGGAQQQLMAGQSYRGAAGGSSSSYNNSAAGNNIHVPIPMRPMNAASADNNQPSANTYSPSNYHLQMSQSPHADHIVQHSPPSSTIAMSNNTIHMHHAGTTLDNVPGPEQQTVKRKRGRPRKYADHTNLPSNLQPATISMSSQLIKSKNKRSPSPLMNSSSNIAKKQQLAALGTVGAAFTPHIIAIAAGEDVALKVMSFSQQGPRAICILSANGAISNVTLRQPATSGGMVTYEGRFEILSLSGSFLPTENAGISSRTGGLSVSLSGPDGRVLGGGVAGLLMAASPVQVVIGSFIANNRNQMQGEAEDEVGLDTSPAAIMDRPSSALYSNTLPAYDSMVTSFPPMPWQDSDIKLDSRTADINICLTGG